MTAAVAVVCAWRDALNRRDIERMLALADDEIEVVTQRGTERGHQSVRAFMQRQAYGVGLYLEKPRLFAAGDTVVLAARAELRWVHTGELADASDMAALFRVLDDRITRFELDDELRRALAAAGLSASHRVTNGHDGPARPHHAQGQQHA
jgi:hypothetical protein